MDKTVLNLTHKICATETQTKKNLHAHTSTGGATMPFFFQASFQVLDIYWVDLPWLPVTA